jgi:4-amino-4-deoxy-L-arabinose transferase-like glycosyltransferase
MAVTPPPATPPEFPLSYDRLVLFFLVGITMLRSVALFLSPLDLGVDEAQYWLWSQTPDFGYFTKPPLIAWIIGAAHWLFGHHSWAVRLPACWIHFATALLLWRAASWIYGPSAGRLAAILWITLPATGLGSFLISTDTPLLCLWSAGLLALCGMASRRLRATPGMALAGFAFGFAMLAKFAAAYALIGLIFIALSDHLETYGRFGKPGKAATQRLFTWRHMAIAFIAFVIAASPTIIWNFAHDFSTVRHLGDNANISKHSYDLTSVWQFLGGQFGVAGPLALAVMLMAASRQSHETRWLLWISLPVLALMIFQSYVSEANANWAMAAYPGLTLMAAGWLAGYLASASRPKRALVIATVGINTAISVAVLLITVSGSLGPLTPASDPLRRLRGWQQLADDVRPLIAAHQATAIIADRRATAALLSWHFYNQPIQILVHDADAIPSNHFEANHSWQPQSGRRLIALSGAPNAPQINGITWLSPATKSVVDISQTGQRSLYIYRGVE